MKGKTNRLPESIKGRQYQIIYYTIIRVDGGHTSYSVVQTGVQHTPGYAQLYGGEGGKVNPLIQMAIIAMAMFVPRRHVLCHAPVA